MTLDTRLLELIVCPVCKGPLTAVVEAGALSALACHADQLAFPVRDGMPVMLENEAMRWPADGTAGTADHDATTNAP